LTDTDDEDGLDPGLVEDIVGPVKRVTAIFGELCWFQSEHKTMHIDISEMVGKKGSP